MYPNVLLENFLYILIDLGPSDAIIKTRMAWHQTYMHYKHENNMEKMSTEEKNQ